MFRYRPRFVLSISLLAATASVHATSWEPTSGAVQIPLWKGSPPNAMAASGPEELKKAKNLVAGIPWHEVTNVTQPTFTLYFPKGFNTGVAVVVLPGGGYKTLAIDIEGTEVCDWLTSKGVTCILLKYRVPNSGCHWDDKCKYHVTPKVFTALQDAQRVMGLIRLNASRWAINPNKVGVIGFSAGGNLVAMLSSHFSKREYSRTDSADDLSCRPDFAIALYPGHMSMTHKNDHALGDSKLNSDIQFTKDTPPTLLVHAQDDKTDPIAYSQLYHDTLKELHVPVELHLFAEGGHAFGLRRTDLPISKWPVLVEDWLRKIRVLEK